MIDGLLVGGVLVIADEQMNDGRGRDGTMINRCSSLIALLASMVYVDRR